MLLASWAAGFLSALPLGTDLPISFEVQPDGRVYLFALSAVLLTGLVVGIIPALRVARSDVTAAPLSALMSADRPEDCVARHA